MKENLVGFSFSFQLDVCNESQKLIVKNFHFFFHHFVCCRLAKQQITQIFIMFHFSFFLFFHFFFSFVFFFVVILSVFHFQQFFFLFPFVWSKFSLYLKNKRKKEQKFLQIRLKQLRKKDVFVFAQVLHYYNDFQVF